MKDAAGILVFWALSALMVFAIWQLAACASYPKPSADDLEYTLSHQDEFLRGK